MPYKRTIVCLANSRKLQGRCVAGLELNGTQIGQWIRPVGDSGKGELFGERLYQTLEDPKLLDVIEIEFLQRRSVSSRAEDHLVNSARKWQRKGKFTRKDLVPAIEQVTGYLWSDGGSTSYGQNDKIPADVAAGLATSLKLIQPHKLRMYIQTEGLSFGKPRRKVRGHFSLDGIDYILAVTDPVVEREFKDAPDGTERTLERPILCISVSEVFEKQNACYKLIAGVLE